MSRTIQAVRVCLAGWRAGYFELQMSRLSYHSPPCASCPWEAGAAQRGPLALIMAVGEQLEMVSFLPNGRFPAEAVHVPSRANGGWAAGVAA